MRSGRTCTLCASVKLPQYIWLLSILATFASGLQILPPIEHPDRASAASGSSVQTDLYNDPQWAKSWYGPVPEHLRTSERDQGFNFTRSMTRVQVAYAVDKIMRNSGNTNRKEQAQRSLDVAKAAFEATKVKHPSASATFVHAPIERLPLEDASIDAVLLFNVLEEMPDMRAAFREMRRVLRPDGIIIFSTRNRSVRSWLSLMWHTELLRDVPAGLYDWRLGVQPGEMKRVASEEGFNMVHEELQGMCESGQWEVRWAEWPWVLQQRDVEFRECSDDTRYLGWAYAVRGTLPGDAHADEDGGDEDSGDASHEADAQDRQEL